MKHVEVSCEHLYSAIKSFAVLAVGIAAISIALDVHAIRGNEATWFAELEAGMFSRADALLWKIDTISAVASATNKSLDHGLLQVRVQVKQASDAQAASIKATTERVATAVARRKAPDVPTPVPPTRDAVRPKFVSPTIPAAPGPVFSGPVPTPALPITIAQPPPPPAKKGKNPWRWLGKAFE